jgi:hypothetical protein
MQGAKPKPVGCWLGAYVTRMLLFRRLLLLWTLLFWQGGFMFYGTVVVPIGTEAFGAEEQGWITRRVTNGLNLAAIPPLAVWAWELAADPADRRRRQTARWLLWALLVVTLIGLAGLHEAMDGQLDLERSRILNRAAFREFHRWYLRVSTLQWAGCVALSYLTLQVWRNRDGRNS